MAARSSPAGARRAARNSPPEGRAKLVRLKARKDFLRVAKGRKFAMPGLVLQVAHAPDEFALQMRAGFTVTKKIGNAVVRNRARRRLKEAAMKMLPLYGRAGHDYVLVGRAETPERKFERLLEDLQSALAKAHPHRTQPDSQE